MTTIGTLLAKNPELKLGGAESDTASVDGAFAIFAAILSNISEQGETPSGLDTPAAGLSAEDLFDQIMTDDSVTPYIDPADRKDLLPILNKILANPESLSSLVDLQDAQAILSKPVAPKMTAASPHDGQDAAAIQPELPLPSPLPAAERIFTTTAVSRSGFASRGGYRTAASPVQMLSSIIRKITMPMTAAGDKTPVITPHVTPDPLKAGHSPEIADIAPPTASVSPATASVSPAITSVSPETASATAATVKTPIQGPVPEMGAVPRIKTGDASVPPTKPQETVAPAAVRTTLMPPAPDGEETAQTGGERPITRAMPPAEPDTGYRKQPAAENGGKSKNHVITAGHPAAEAPAMKTAIAKASVLETTASAAKHDAPHSESQISGQQASSGRTTPALATGQAPPAPAAAASGGDGGGQFQQQHQHHQPQSSIDTTMGLDQGRDGRLLRLSVSDNGWQNRLIQHINGTKDGSKEQTITVLLQPRRLGRLTVNISLSGSATTVNILASSAEAATLLQDQETRLQQAFDQNGLKLSTMQTSSQQGGQNPGQHGNSRKAQQTTAEGNTKETPSEENSSTKIQVNANNGQINILV